MRQTVWIGRQFWRIARAYWTSEERASAWLILAATVACVLTKVYTAVMLNDAGGRFFNGLQNRNPAAFYRTMLFIAAFLLFQLVCIVLQAFLSQLLEARWRRWLTARYTKRWLAHRAFYEMRFRGRADNPDQRIAEDLRLLTTGTLDLGLGFLSMTVTVAAFAAVLWEISGYLLWAALLYWFVGAALGYALGNPLILLNNRQQGLEADFRFALIRIRENAEGIAFYGGESREQSRSRRLFHPVYLNYLAIVLRSAKLLAFQTFLGDGPDILPFLAVAPRYFSGAMALGDLMRVGNGFGQISRALAWLVNAYPVFAEWHATVDRLVEFGAELDDIDAGLSGFEATHSSDGSIRLENASVDLPGGRALLPAFNLRLTRGESVLIRGISGSGKSTLFRVLAGLWPFGHGRLERPHDARLLFLPQQPYVPIGSLREALWFPEAPRRESDDKIRVALREVDLDRLGSRLDDVAHWQQLLSPGEQQRLAIAQAILQEPDWLFLDEATSALDEDQESAVYEALRRLLPHSTIVSIGHRRTLERFHGRLITMSSGELLELVP